MLPVRSKKSRETAKNMALNLDLDYVFRWLLGTLRSQEAFPLTFRPELRGWHCQEQLEPRLVRHVYVFWVHFYMLWCWKSSRLRALCSMFETIPLLITASRTALAGMGGPHFGHLVEIRRSASRNLIYHDCNDFVRSIWPVHKRNLQH